jgi:azurin
VLAYPGKGQAVGQLALEMGIDGMERNYVPDSDDVIAHTAILQPDTTETIYFTAPLEPGDYEFICSFPGHAAVMTGILRVE